MPYRLFVSYSHKDEKHKDFVVDHLKVAERQGVFDVWEDRRIKGGEAWHAKIDEALDQADIVVLLISKHFLTSDFIMDHEVQTTLERHVSDDVILYPILVSDCAWQIVDWLQAINIRPTDGKPLTSFDEAVRDRVMADIASEIAQLRNPNGTTKGRALDKKSPILASPSRQPYGARKDIWHWWRSADITARATVLGALFGGLVLLWSVMSGIGAGGDQISAECSAVNTGSIKGAEINLDCTKTEDAN